MLSSICCVSVTVSDHLAPFNIYSCNFQFIFEKQLDASGRTDESLAVEFVGPLQPSSEDGLQSGKLLSISLQKGQLRANICFQPFHSANLEVSIFKF